MTKFINYLNEKRGRSVTHEQIVNFIRKNCQDAVKSYFRGNVIYRGFYDSYGAYGIINQLLKGLVQILIIIIL